MAREFRWADRIRALLAERPDLVNEPLGPNGATPLHIAAWENDRDLIQVLLDAGADPSIEDTAFNATPSDWAYQNGHVETGAWLADEIQQRWNKARLLSEVQSERQHLEALLAKLPRDEMLHSGVVGEWSVKDLLAHLIDWERRFVGWYEAGVRGEVPKTPDPDFDWDNLNELNQHIFELHRNRTLDDVLAEFKASHQQTLGLLQSMSEEEIFTAGYYAWVGDGRLFGFVRENTGKHYRWARKQIERWLDISDN